jgi:hypothetical protein
MGALFIIAMATSLINGIFLESLDTQEYLIAVSPNENLVVKGVLIMFSLTVSVVSIPIMMFPILRKHKESLSLGYVGARIFEGFCDAIVEKLTSNFEAFQNDLTLITFEIFG